MVLAEAALQFSASSICLGCQRGGKRCDFTHFLHPARHSSVSALARVNTNSRLPLETRCCGSKRTFLFWGRTCFIDVKSRITLGKLNRFASLVPKDPGAGLGREKQTNEYCEVTYVSNNVQPSYVSQSNCCSFLSFPMLLRH